MAEATLTVEHVEQGTVCVAPHGDLDVESAYRFDAAVQQIQAATGPGTLVVDLRDVGFVDSAGVGRLVAVARRGRELGERVCFVRGPRAVTRLFALTGVGAGISWVRTPEEAWTGRTARLRA